MLVRRLINTEEYERVNKQVLITNNSKDLSNCAEIKKSVEECLDNYRINNNLSENSRLDSLFVFPNDNVVNRAKHWGLIMVPKPGDCTDCYLLTLSVDKDISWHDATFFEDLYFLKSGRKCLMKNRNMSETDLLSAYWQRNNNTDSITIEGMVKSASIIKIEKCIIGHTSFEIVEEIPL